MNVWGCIRKMADNEENKVIELRGHHLVGLCFKHFEKEFKDNAAFHHGEGAYEEFANTALGMQINEYSSEYANNSSNVYFHLLDTPEQMVKITGSYDMLCKNCPPKKKNECPNTSSLDNRVAYDLFLGLDKTYPMKEIAKRMNLTGLTVLRKWREGKYTTNSSQS